MDKLYQKYKYNGPVIAFGKCITDRWEGETMAKSKKQAKSNLIYQVKKQMNLVAGTKITLPGEIKSVS